MARRIGVSRAAVGKWELDETAPTRKRAPRVAKVLGLSLENMSPYGKVQPSDAATNDTDAAMPTPSLKDEMAMIRFLWGRLQSFDPMTRRRIIN